MLDPWAHNGWARASGDVLGPVPLGSKTADDFREKIQRPWFAYYLHGTGDGQFPDAWMFESGGNTWRSFDAWPPRTSQTRNIYLYRFTRGHRLMVRIQSTWFPLYDRNPQRFVPNIFNATVADFCAQQHRVWHTATYPTHIAVRVLP